MQVSRFSVFQDVPRVHEDKRPGKDEDVVDFAMVRGSERMSPIDGDVTGSPTYLQKPEAFGKTPSPVLSEAEYSEVDPNRSVEIIRGRCSSD